MPYSSKLMNLLELFNDLATLVCLYVYILFTNINLEAQSRYDLGWHFIGLVIAIMALNMIVIMGVVINKVYKVVTFKLKQYCNNSQH